MHVLKHFFELGLGFFATGHRAVVVAIGHFQVVVRDTFDAEVVTLIDIVAVGHGRWSGSRFVADSAWNRRSRRWISGKTIGSGPFLPPEVLRLPCVPSFRRLLRLPACSGCRRRKSRNNTRLDDRRSHDFVIHRRRRTVFEFVVIVESDSLCSYPRSVVEDPRRPEVGLEDVRFDLVGSFSV